MRRLRRKSTGTRRPASAAKSSRSSTGLSRKVRGYVLCVSNAGYPASLEVRKLYGYLDPLPNDPKSRIRVVDESGEDYLFPRVFFRRIALPPGQSGERSSHNTKSPDGWWLSGRRLPIHSSRWLDGALVVVVNGVSHRPGLPGQNSGGENFVANETRFAPPG